MKHVPRLTGAVAAADPVVVAGEADLAVAAADPVVAEVVAAEETEAVLVVAVAADAAGKQLRT